MKRPRKVVVDSNLLILLVVGLVDVRLIEGQKRLKIFSIDDYLFLKRQLESYDEIVLTPNTLTETSNLILNREANWKTSDKRIGLKLAEMIDRLDECYIESRKSVGRTEFKYLGLTDSAILELLEDENIELLTTDAALHIAAQKLGRHSINFNHLRDFG